MKKKINNNYNKNAYGKEKFIEIVCADPYKEKIYTTSFTLKKMFEFGDFSLLDEWKEKYPNYGVEVNDEFFLNHIGRIPQ